MEQLRQFWIFCRIYALVWANSCIFYLKRIPFVSMLLPKDVYRREKWKGIFWLGGALKHFVQDAVGVNFAFLILLYWLPSLLFEEVTGGGMTCICLLVCGAVPAILQCKIFTAHEEDYLFLNHFMVEPGAYYHLKIARDALKNGVYLIPVFWYLLRKPELIVVAVVGKIFFVLLGCRIYLHIYDKRQQLIRRTYRYLAGFGILGVVYLLWGLGIWGRVSLSRETVVVSVVLMGTAAGVMYFQLLHYRAYKKIAVQFANRDVVMLKVSAVSAVEEGQQALGDTDKIDFRQYYEQNRHLDAASYLNQTFLKRLNKSFAGHKKQVVWVNLLFGIIIGTLNRLDVLQLTEETIMQYTPILIALISSLMLQGRNFSAMCFYYVDRPFLYHHLFQKNFLKKSIRMRQAYLLKNSLWVLLWLAVDFVLILLVGGISIEWYQIALLLVTLECFIVSYEVYHLLICFLFQPYGEDITVRSPVFTWLGMLEGVLDVGVLFVRGSIVNALLPMVIICVALNLILMFSTKSMYERYRLRY